MWAVWATVGHGARVLLRMIGCAALIVGLCCCVLVGCGLGCCVWGSDCQLLRGWGVWSLGRLCCGHVVWFRLYHMCVGCCFVLVSCVGCMLCMACWVVIPGGLSVWSVVFSLPVAGSWGVVLYGSRGGCVDIYSVLIRVCCG